MQKITPFLWFDTQAEEAANYYVSIFSNSTLGDISRYPEGGPRPAGMAMGVNFSLDGLDFIALNAGPEFTFTEAISMFVSCEDQAEVDYFWEKLTEGGQESRCGWLKDKFGVSWQVIPKQMGEYLGNPDPEKAGRAMQAMMGMSKIIIDDLKNA